MARFQVKDIGMSGDGPRFLHKFVRHPPQFGDFCGRQDLFDAEVTVGVVKVNLFLSKHEV